MSCTDLTCDFTDTSTDSQGSVVAWSWDFGDGTTSTAQNPSRTYAAAGTYTVTLTATDDVGATDTFGRDVTVPSTNQGPTAAFTSSCTDLACTFTDTSADGDGTVVAWSWDFGDGATSVAQNPSHTYPGPGSYTVTLMASDDDGASDTFASDLTVIMYFLQNQHSYALVAQQYTGSYITRVGLYNHTLASPTGSWWPERITFSASSTLASTTDTGSSNTECRCP